MQPLPCGLSEQHVKYGGLDREFRVYIPFELCSAQSAKQTELLVPMVLSIHCYGCDWNHEYEKYHQLADALGFILLVPRGVANSWNSRDCCGTALKDNLDDVGFISKVVEMVLEQPEGQWVTPSPDSIYVTGFSNGGFMSSLLALLHANTPPDSPKAIEWVRGAAPTAGEMQDIELYAVNTQTTPTPIFMHHSIEDTFVRIDGCCSSQKCCCQIRDSEEQCTSVANNFEDWQRINGCSGKTTSMSLDSLFQDSPGESASPSYPTCLVAQGCKEPTIYCQWTGPHSQWATSFDGAGSVAEFFMKDVCERNKGQWHHDQLHCQCSFDSPNRYCLSGNDLATTSTQFPASVSASASTSASASDYGASAPAPGLVASWVVWSFVGVFVLLVVGCLGLYYLLRGRVVTLRRNNSQKIELERLVDD